MRNFRLGFCFCVVLAEVFVLSLTNSVAQDLNPIRWSVKKENPSLAVKAGDKFDAQVIATIDEGWHLYSLDQPAGGPIPTHISIPENQKFKLAGDIESPLPQVVFDPNFNIDTQFYEGEAVFKLPIEIAKDAQPGKNMLFVNAFFQTCNDRTCLPPKTVKLNTEIEVAGAQGTSGKQADNSQVKAQLDAAKAALDKKDFGAAKSAYERAIEIDPFNYEAHSGLVEASASQIRDQLFVNGEIISDEKALKEIGDKLKADQARMTTKYEGLEAKYPDKAVFKLVLASLNIYEPVKRKDYLEQAYKLEPNNLEVLTGLASFEASRGDSRRAVEYYEKIVEQKPDDIDAAFSYAFRFNDVDKKLYKEKSREFIKRFPNTERAAQTLYWLAANSEDESERIGYLEELKRTYPPAKFGWSESGMGTLFGIYTLTAPDKALALANEMLSASISPAQKKEWQAFVDYQSDVNKANALVSGKKPTEATAVLDKIKIPRYFKTTSPFYLLKAKALDAAGQSAAAYQQLLDSVVNRPSEELLREMKAQGRKLGKDESQIEADLQAKIAAQTKPIKDFSLARFDIDKKVSLADYRGKVVLLNFWYPMCGPCHGEAPYLEKLIKKYGKDDFVILSPSVHPKEDSLVIPYFQSTKFDFIPLKVPDEEWASKEYGARGFPTNYLIDKQGRKIFDLGVVYQDRMEEVQLLIEMALAQKP